MIQLQSKTLQHGVCKGDGWRAPNVVSGSLVKTARDTATCSGMAGWLNCALSLTDRGKNPTVPFIARPTKPTKRGAAF